MDKSVKMIIIGGLLLLVGAGLPFLIVTHLIAPSLWLELLAYMTSIAGLVIGMLGLAQLQMRRFR